jgi:diguanylate cyclase
VRLYPLLRILALPIFLAYMGVRLVVPEISILGDLLLFNLVGIFAGLSAIAARSTPRATRIPIALGILTWTIGSIVSSWNALRSDELPEWIGDAGYLAFYPMLFFGLMSALRQPQGNNRLNLLDALIIAIGLSSMLSVLTLTITAAELQISGYEAILQNFYPIADVLLLATALVIVFRSGIDLRNTLTVIALFIFTLTDLLFLVQSASGSYRFGSLLDSGWLIAIILIAESQWHRQSERIKRSTHPLLSTLVAAIGSGLVIALKVLRPNEVPDAAMIPAFLTLMLAFIRMSLALIEAQHLNEAQVLAKTDELTGLANRRKFIEELRGVEPGDFLILIDLNGFKPINDNFGHGAGDELLRQTALRLSRSLEREWTFARLGGDEFGLLVKRGGRIAEVAQSISASFSYPFHLGSVGEASISASIGVAEVTDKVSGEVRAESELLRSADLAMYHAKRTGQAIAYWSEVKAYASTVSPLVDRR